MQEDQYLIPDYYPSFACKQGACRTPCCEGWPVTISMQDYFRLLSVPCSAELRRRLDGALHLCEHPSPEAYAQICPRWDGKCPLHQEDGRCMLHAEVGEELLSAVCRLYPRGARGGGSRECSCANSCEAVVEMFLRRREPLQFVSAPLVIECPDIPRTHVFQTDGRELNIRLWLIRLMQAREIPLPRRLLRLGEALAIVDEAIVSKDFRRLDALLDGQGALPLPPAPAAGHHELLAGLTVAEALMKIIDGRSRSVHDYGEAALAFFGEGEDAFRRYAEANAALNALMPDWEVWFEHMLVNHMFFAQFPFQDRPVPLADEYLALCAVYVLLRFLCVSRAAADPRQEALADVCAAAFRLVEHTSFDRFAGPVLRELGCGDRRHLQQLLCL